MSGTDLGIIAYFPSQDIDEAHFRLRIESVYNKINKEIEIPCPGGAPDEAYHFLGNLQQDISPLLDELTAGIHRKFIQQW